ncbi:MAG: tetratricopeptide repeat protein [Bdellovibrionales bacterium]|nr:tetratricopeptide repeat protein [Bdellovibrionales bacterium]
MKWWRTWKTLPVYSWVKAAKHYKEGKFETAAHWYERGLKRHKNHPAELCARLDLAYCLFQGKKLEEAESHLKFVAHHMPHSKEAHLRLARLQLWTGRSLDAAWTMRRALRSSPHEPELVAFFMYSVLDNGGPKYLLKEAIDASLCIEEEAEFNLLLEATKARVSQIRGKGAGAQEYLERLAGNEKAPLEVLLIVGELAIKDREIAKARRYLRKALSISPDHPRVLSLLAESYLQSGPFYNPDYAQQLVTTACQNTNWLSPREMHVLAEAYYHQEDKISALIIASKAKEEGSRLLGTYRDAAMLDRLIENLSTGTQA